MDYFSINQQHGLVGNTNHCGNYYTYQSLGKTQSAGGYRVAPTAGAHPCGEVMKNYNVGKSWFHVDIVYLVNSQGGTPTLDNGDLVSKFNKGHFVRLGQYQLSQWIDVQSTQFVNYFTVPATGTKYQLLGKASVTQGNYQIVMQNNYLTQGEFTKKLLITEVGLLGSTNHVLGFTAFAYGKHAYI